MDKHFILKQLDEERRTLVYDGQRAEVLPLVTRVQFDGGKHHAIVFSKLSQATAGDAISEQAFYFRSRKIPVEWKVYRHDNPSDLSDRLELQGFVRGERESVVVLDLHDGHDWLAPRSTIQITRVETIRQVEQFRVTAESIFKKSYASTANALAACLEIGSAQQLGFIAIVDGMPAGVGLLYTHPQSIFGGLYCGGVIEQFRGKGLYRALVAARANAALELGARYLQIDALPTSKPILLRMGFEEITETWPMVLKIEP